MLFKNSWSKWRKIVKINIKNEAKVRAAMEPIHANEKGEIHMSAHDYYDIHRLAFYSELDFSGHIPAKLMPGIKIRQQKTFVGDNESMGLCTEAVIERGDKGWFLTSYRIMDCDAVTEYNEPGIYRTREIILNMELRDYLTEKGTELPPHLRKFLT